MMYKDVADEIIKDVVSSLNQNEINDLFQVANKSAYYEDITDDPMYYEYKKIKDRIFTKCSDLNGNVDNRDVDQYIADETYKYVGI